MWKFVIGFCFLMLAIKAFYPGQSSPSREYSRGLMVATLKFEQDNYTGPKDKSGCFELPRRADHQQFIDRNKFTTKELNQTFDTLFCYGGIFAAK